MTGPDQDQRARTQREGVTLRSFRDFHPTQFDRALLFGDERDDWLVAPVFIDRDTGSMGALSTWHRTLKALETLDPKREDYQIHRFKHWAVGWFEIILIRPGSRCAQRMRRRERRRTTPWTVCGEEKKGGVLVSRRYEMQVRVLGVLLKKFDTVIEAAQKEWDFDRDRWSSFPLTGRPELLYLEGFGESSLYGGEPEEAFVDRLYKAMRDANGVDFVKEEDEAGPFTVEARRLEKRPYTSHVRPEKAIP